MYPGRGAGSPLDRDHLEAEQRIGDPLLGGHHLGAWIALVDGRFRVFGRHRENRISNLREIAAAVLDRRSRRERRRLDLGHRAGAVGCFGAVQAGIGEIGILEHEHRALPDVGVDHLCARGQRRPERQVGLLLEDVERAARRGAGRRREDAAHPVGVDDPLAERDAAARDDHGAAHGRHAVADRIVAERVGA
jgi:hypothetical protein